MKDYLSELVVEVVAKHGRGEAGEKVNQEQQTKQGRWTVRLHSYMYVYMYV